MASARRGDQRLIAVVMGDSSENQRVVDAQALLNWGFRFTNRTSFTTPGKQVATQRSNRRHRQRAPGVSQPPAGERQPARPVRPHEGDDGHPEDAGRADRQGQALGNGEGRADAS